MAGFTVSNATLIFGALLAILVAMITVFDLRHLIIPDSLNISLAIGGFAYQSWLIAAIAWRQVIFAIVVAALFMAVYLWFIRIRGKHGLGLGDVKMAGAASLWFSPWNLSLFLLVTCVTAMIFVFFGYLRGASFNRSTKVPFGPFLGLGVFVTWLLENTGMPTFIPSGGI